MKTSLIIYVVLVSRIHAEFISPFPMEYDQIVDACRNETGYTDEVVEKEEESYFSENRGLRKYHYCFLEKTGFVTSDGRLNIDDALAKLSPGLLKDVVEHCNGREKTHPKTIFSTCFHSEVKHHMQLVLIKYVTDVIYEHFTQIVEVCRMETGYTDKVIAEEEKNDLNTSLKKFNDCFLEKTGFRNYEKFDLDRALARIPQSNVTTIIELCQLKTMEKIIPNSMPFFSACLHVGVSDYIRTTESKAIKSGAQWSLRAFRWVDTSQECERVYLYIPSPGHMVVYVTLPPSQDEKADNYAYACIKDTGVTTETLAEFRKGNFIDDERLKQFIFCFLKKADIITSDGKLNIDVALAKLPTGIDKDAAKVLLENCQSKIGSNTIDTVYEIFKCYSYGTKVHIKLDFKI